MNIAGMVLIFAGLILLALLPRLRPAKPPLRLGLTSKSPPDGELASQETRGAENRSQAA